MTEPEVPNKVRLIAIMNSMVKAFAGPSHPGQLDDAVAAVVATNPTRLELSDTREMLLGRYDGYVTAGGATAEWSASDRAKRVEALALAERRLYSDD